MVWRIFHGFNWYLYLDMITQYKFSCCLYVARIYSVVELVLINCAEYEGKITVKLLGMYCFCTVGVGGKAEIAFTFPFDSSLFGMYGWETVSSCSLFLLFYVSIEDDLSR